ncbi:hypothetical protein [Paenibacillus agricola]|uniref:Uncharacterized protein n=1 Tax=Paenibacillus agricola TaxID=2716264 RepID=A0ABX0JKU1_9BACL|nr:hypothetical protein [Paenibacillus agricola]NHN35548.1 hypothetical protein [Paenibacillus agricola]
MKKNRVLLVLKRDLVYCQICGKIIPNELIDIEMANWIEIIDGKMSLMHCVDCYMGERWIPGIFENL